MLSSISHKSSLFLVSSKQWERVKQHAVLRTEILGKGICLDSFQ